MSDDATPDGEVSQCSHQDHRVVDACIQGRGSYDTGVIKECQYCGGLWFEHRDKITSKDETGEGGLFP